MLPDVYGVCTMQNINKNKRDAAIMQRELDEANGCVMPICA